MNNVFFVSRYEDGSVIVTPCVIDEETHHITDIVTVDITPCAAMQREYVLINGFEYDVVQEGEYDGSPNVYYY